MARKTVLSDRPAGVAKLGFSHAMAVLLLTAVILGSTINIPLYRLESQVDSSDDFTYFCLKQFWGIPLRKVRRSTVIALNVGGRVNSSSTGAVQFSRVQPLAIVLVTAIVALVVSKKGIKGASDIVNV